EFRATQNYAGGNRAVGPAITFPLYFEFGLTTVIHPNAARVVAPTGTLDALGITQCAAEANAATRVRGTVLASVATGLERFAANSLRLLVGATIGFAGDGVGQA